MRCVTVWLDFNILKLRQVLKSEATLLQSATGIKKVVRHMLQSRAVHLLTNVNKRLSRNFFSLLKSENIKENVKRTGVGYASRNQALLFFGKTPKQTKKRFL